jgi:hypothetical protein
MEVAAHPQESPRPRLRSPLRAALLVTVAALFLALSATSADAAHVAKGTATGEVQHWTSNQAYDAPIAVVDVRHDGHLLDGTAVDRCRRTYVDKDITVQVGTCGKRWHVRAAYVSLSGRTERFQILYSPRG